MFLWDEYCSDAPIFPLLPQGGGNDSTAAQGRRRIRRVTQMVRFELLKLPEAWTFHVYRQKHFENTFRCVFAYVPVEQDNRTGRNCSKIPCICLNLNMGLIMKWFYVQSSSIITTKGPNPFWCLLVLSCKKKYIYFLNSGLLWQR